MRLLSLLLIGVLAVFALLSVAGVFARSLLRGTGRPPRAPSPEIRKTKPADEVIDVQATVVSADQDDR